MPQTVIVQLSEEDCLLNHVPDWVFNMCHNDDYNVFYEDKKTGELVQVLDLIGISQ